MKSALVPLNDFKCRPDMLGADFFFYSWVFDLERYDSRCQTHDLKLMSKTLALPLDHKTVFSWQNQLQKSTDR